MEYNVKHLNDMLAGAKVRLFRKFTTNNIYGYIRKFYIVKPNDKAGFIACDISYNDVKCRHRKLKTYEMEAATFLGILDGLIEKAYLGAEDELKFPLEHWTNASKDDDEKAFAKMFLNWEVCFLDKTYKEISAIVRIPAFTGEERINSMQSVLTVKNKLPVEKFCNACCKHVLEIHDIATILTRKNSYNGLKKEEFLNNKYISKDGCRIPKRLPTNLNDPNCTSIKELVQNALKILGIFLLIISNFF
jgi:hypothetical protein